MKSLSRREFSLAALAGLAACGSGGAGESATVNVYSARHYDADRRLYAAFEEATGIAVRVLPASAEQLLQRLEAEGDATEADLVIAADAGNLWRLKQAGVLRTVTSPALEAGVPANLRDPDGAYWGFTKRARVIIHRKDAVRPEEAASLDDLATARFRNQVVARTSTNMYQLSTLASRIERLGADNARAWAAGVRANFVRDPQGSDTDQIKAVAAGEAQVTFCNHYYYFRLLRSQDPADREIAAKVGIIMPDQAGGGAHINISGAGIAAHSKRPENAQRLLEYMITDEAQRLLAPLTDEFPIRPDLPGAPELASLGTFKEESIPLDALGRHQVEAARIFEEVGWR